MFTCIMKKLRVSKCKDFRFVLACLNVKLTFHTHQRMYISRKLKLSAVVAVINCGVTRFGASELSIASLMNEVECQVLS